MFKIWSLVETGNQRHVCHYMADEDILTILSKVCKRELRNGESVLSRLESFSLPKNPRLLWSRDSLRCPQEATNDAHYEPDVSSGHSSTVYFQDPF